MKNITKAPIKKGNVSIRNKIKGVHGNDINNPIKVTKKSVTKKSTNYLTIKQRNLIEKLSEKVEKGGNTTLGETLIAAGYSKNTAKTPQKVFGNQAVAKAIKEIGLDQESFMTIHKSLLNATKSVIMKRSIDIPQEEYIESIEENIPGAKFLCLTVNKGMGMVEYEFLVPDNELIIKGLEFGYKYLKIKPIIEDTKIRNGSSSKRLKKIEDLAQKLRLNLKKPTNTEG